MHGRKGQITLSGAQVAQLVSWNYSQDMGTIDAGYMNAIGVVYEAGLADGSGSFNFHYLESDVGYQTGYTCLTAGTRCTLILYPDKDNSGKVYSGSVLLTSYKISGDKDSMVDGSFDFKGLLSYVTKP